MGCGCPDETPEPTVADDEADAAASCHWRYLPVEDSWETECGGVCRLALGADLDAVRFCPYCGHRTRKPPTRALEQARPGDRPPVTHGT